MSEIALELFGLQMSWNDIVYYGLHVIGFVGILVYLSILSPKYGEKKLRVILCGASSYATVYVVMLLLFWWIRGSFGGQNVIRPFLLLPAIIWFYAKIFKVDVRNMEDLAAPAVPLAQFFGKIGCQIVGCCRSNQEAAWGIYNPIANKKLFPIQLVEGVTAGIIAAVTVWYMKKHDYKTHGICMPIVLVSFGGTRFIFEFLRDNDKLFFGISELALWSLGMVIVGVIWLLALQHKKAKRAAEN